MQVFTVLADFFIGVWKFLKSTLLSKKWWDKYYWIPVAFLVGLILWILSGGRKNPTEKIVNRLNDIRNEEQKNIIEIRHDASKEESKLESEAREEKERIQRETRSKVADAKKQIDNENKALKDDSEAVNSILNDLLD